MAGTITALKFQKRNQERVSVFLDDAYAFSVTALVAANLKKGQHLSDAEIEQLKEGDEWSRAYQQAVRYLSFRARSQTEVARHLKGKGYLPQVVTGTIERLREEQYLDDEAFARFWLRDRERFRPRGRRALRYELRQKGLADEVIETVLVDIDEDELAWAAVEPKLPQWQHLAEENLKRKMMGFLSRRGFDYEVAQNVFYRAQEAIYSSK